jgi:hypothetical protein
MNSPEQLGEIAFGERLIDAGFGPRSLNVYPIFYLSSHPGLIVRHAATRNYRAEHHDTYWQPAGQLTQGLLHLDTEYGLHTPGLSMAREIYTVNNTVIVDGPDKQRERLYFVTPRVVGISFLDRLSEVPETTATKAFSSIMRYHEDLLRYDSVHLHDVRLSQLIYGKIPNDTEDRVYFVDIEPHYDLIDESIRQKSSAISDYAVFVAQFFIEDIDELEAAFGKRFTGLRQQLGRLFIAFNNAYHNIKGIDLNYECRGLTDEIVARIPQFMSEAAEN